MTLPKAPVYREAVSARITKELHDLIYCPGDLTPEMATAMAKYGAEQARKSYEAARRSRRKTVGENR